MGSMIRRPSALERAGQGRLRTILSALLFAVVALSLETPVTSQTDASLLVSGKVVDLTGNPVVGAVVTLHRASTKDVTGKTDASGMFRLRTQQAAYDVSVDTVDHRHGEQTAAQSGSPLRIVVKPAVSAQTTMEFSDKPDFTVAGVTDWTAVGGHGSDATLRTSEQMARQTAALKSSAPVGDFAAKDGAGSRSRPREDLAAQADLHRIAGEQDERHGDPLGAAREEEQASALDPSEKNFFTWGSELLLHRAIWQAAEVFAKGSRLHPESQRLKTGWGAALFAGAKYDDAAAHLCEASDLDPANRETYLFLAKLGVASPSPEPCVSEKLARFLQTRPNDADANYYEAMMLLKDDPHGSQTRAAGLLRTAVVLNPGFADAYLQLGILALAQRDNAVAEASFMKAIAADSSQAEAHYRLGVVYDRTGRSDQAKIEFARHEALAKEQADAVERERRQVKQFLIVLGHDAPANATP